MRKQQAYYYVFGLKDGTIWFAIPKRKPVKVMGKKPQIDEEGVFQWSIEKEDEGQELTAVAKAIRGATFANALNMRKILRESVTGRLDRMETQLTALQEQLTRIEKALARVTAPETGNDRSTSCNR